MEIKVQHLAADGITEVPQENAVLIQHYCSTHMCLQTSTGIEYDDPIDKYPTANTYVLGTPKEGVVEFPPMKRDTFWQGVYLATLNKPSIKKGATKEQVIEMTEQYPIEQAIKDLSVIHWKEATYFDRVKDAPLLDPAMMAIGGFTTEQVDRWFHSADWQELLK